MQITPDPSHLRATRFANTLHPQAHNGVNEMSLSKGYSQGINPAGHTLLPRPVDQNDSVPEFAHSRQKRFWP